MKIGRARWAAGVFLFICLASAMAAKCKCKVADPKETTIWGGNQYVVLINEKPYRSIHGMVKLGADEEPTEKALVEIFTNPEHLLDESFRPENGENQKRVRACITGADGKFCFDHLPAGKYELRVSISRGWDVTSEYVVVDPTQGQGGEIEVRLHIGT